MERTKQVKRLRNIFGITSSVVWVGTAIFMVISALSKVGGADTTQILTEEAKNMLMSISITTIIGVVAAIIIKDKLRTAIWMACTILSAIVFKEVGMYVTLGLWFVDEYILFNLFKHYKNLVVINKEIDLRE